MSTLSTTRRGITLVELMVVMTIMALGVGVTTLRIHGIGARASLRAAATELESIYRSASSKALRSGLPLVMELSEKDCLLRRPRLREGEWRWERAARFEITRGVKVVSATVLARPTSFTDGPPWRIVANPGDRVTRWRIELRSGRLMKAVLLLDGYSSELSVVDEQHAQQ